MPIYEYRCANGHTFEVFQSMSEDPVASCEECGVPVERVFHPVAVHFKGSGFYTTDYARKGSGRAGSDGGAKRSDGGGGGNGADGNAGEQAKSDSAAATSSSSSGSNGS